MTVQQPIANLSHEPGGNRASQLLFGERVLVLEVVDGQAFGQSERDGYVGWVGSAALTQAPEATHWVIARHASLPAPDFKAQAEVALFFGSTVHVTAERQDFHRIQTGHFVPRQHLMPIAARFDDPVGVADLFLARPISGAGPAVGVSTAPAWCNWPLWPAARPAPRQRSAGRGTWARTSTSGRRSSAATWCSGTGMWADGGREDAAACQRHHMSVAYEPLKDAAARIEDGRRGPVTRRKRFRNPA
jgi:hypothetical protein